jgi:hypothetical protein
VLPKPEQSKSKKPWVTLGINQDSIDSLKKVPVEAIKEIILDPEMQKFIHNNELSKGFSFVGDYLNATPEKRSSMTKTFVKDCNDELKIAKTEFKQQGMDKTVEAWWNFFLPGHWYLARYGVVFGAAVWAGFNGLYFAQQALKDYLALRRPKYISPLSSLGLVDRYKHLAKKLVYGLFKRKQDVQANALVDDLKKHITKGLTFKKGGSFCVHNSSYKSSTHLFSALAKQVGMDFIAVSAVYLLDKKIGPELWNDIMQLIHKNGYPVLLYIDQAELLSMDGTEYSKREDNVRIFASCFHSAIPAISSKCVLVGAMNNQDVLQGPFASILTKHLNL